MDLKAVVDVAKDSAHQAEQSYEEKRPYYEAMAAIAGGRPGGSGSTGSYAAGLIAGLVSAPRKVDWAEGEVEFEELRRMVAEGELTGMDFVDDGSGWVLLEHYPPLADCVPKVRRTNPVHVLIVVGAVVTVLGLLALLFS